MTLALASPMTPIPYSLCLLFAALFQATAGQRLKTNDRPVVGILSQEYFGRFKDYKQQKSYIAASYVKSMESAGARVVPILLDRPPLYYQNIVRSVNGILFPGGGQDLLNSSYSRTGKILYDTVKRLNDRGDYFPLWTTCLGFELIFVLETGKFNFTRCNELDTAVKIGFLEDYDQLRNSSQIFNSISNEMFQVMSTKQVAYNYHKWCLTNQSFEDMGMDKLFNIIAINRDREDREYISIIESKKYPIFGVQFHPEKPQFEFILKPGHRNVPHTSDSVQSGQLFANFFVDECRKNGHDYDSVSTSEVPLIYKFTAEFTASVDSYMQTYFFDLKE